MRKLTDVELSKVLSRAAVGGLNHCTFGNEDCGCVGGTVHDIGPGAWNSLSPIKQADARELSDCLWPSPMAGERYDYGGDPDSVLRFLESRGVA